MVKSIEIWQASINCRYKFRSYNKEQFNIKDYVHIYSGIIETIQKDEEAFLEDIFYIFNQSHPKDYHGASLSVSDLICIINNNHKDWWYVNSIGFIKINLLNNVN